MTDITQDDERNIQHFANLYKSPQADVEDLAQAGRLAVLQAPSPSHKYNALRQAIRQEAFSLNYHNRLKPMSRDIRTQALIVETLNEGLKTLEDQDELSHLISQANLTSEELLILELRFFLGLTLSEIGERISLHRNIPLSTPLTKKAISDALKRILLKLKLSVKEPA